MLFCLPFSSHSCSILWSPVEKKREEEEGKRERNGGEEREEGEIESFKMGIALILWQLSLGVKIDMKNQVLKDFSLPVSQLRVFGSVLFMYLSGAFNLLSIYHLWNNQVLTWDILTPAFPSLPSWSSPQCRKGEWRLGAEGGHTLGYNYAFIVPLMLCQRNVSSAFMSLWWSVIHTPCNLSNL